MHHNFDDSDSGYDMDMEQRARDNRGRIILLGNGSEVLTDSDDTEMFDHSEEDKDLESQVHKIEPANDIASKDGAVPKSDKSPENLATLESHETLPATAASREALAKASGESKAK